MKIPPFYILLIGTALLAASGPLNAQSSTDIPTPLITTNVVGPRLSFITNQYHFGKISAGTVVKHVFTLTNTGDQALEIFKVAPGCHCTTAGDWTHKVAPGKTGEIAIQFDSGVFRGAVTKTVTVTSNDKLAPRQTISLEGTIWRAIDVNPQFAYITVPPDGFSNAVSVVHIVNQTDQPLTLSDPVSANGSFRAEMKTIKPGMEFEITVHAVPPMAAGNTSGSLTITTSSTNMPVISITTLASVQPSVGVVPMQIVLPPRIDNWLTNRVSVTANGKRSLGPSDPTICCDKQAKVELATLSPGRVYQLIVSFPPGFQSNPGPPAQVTVKSDNPEHPVIIVPIIQAPHQTSVPVPAPHTRVLGQTEVPLPHP